MATQANTHPEFVAECERIDTARESLFASLKSANAHGFTGRDAHAMFEGMDALDADTAALKRKFYPRRAGRLSIALGGAILVSPTGRTSGFLWRSVRPAESEDEERGDEGR